MDDALRNKVQLQGEGGTEKDLPYQLLIDKWNMKREYRQCRQKIDKTQIVIEKII